MGDDSSGYRAAIAEVDGTGQLSERQTKIAIGVSMIRDGESIHGAAQRCGIPYATLYRHNAGLSHPDYEKAFQASERALIDSQLAIAGRASEQVFKRVDDGDMSDQNLINAMKSSATLVSIKRRWGQTQTQGSDRTQDALAAALESMRQGAKVSIEQPDPVADAIEIEAIGDE